MSYFQNSHLYYFDMHDHDKDILCGLLKAQHNWISETLIDPRVVIFWDDKLGRIIAEIESHEIGTEFGDAQSQFINWIDFVRQRLLQLQCMETEVA